MTGAGGYLAPVRPQATDIAAPELPPRLRWAGSPPASMAELTTTGPVLVHFFDFAQLNSVRALPYVLAWHGRYAASGLAVIGVQAPRFAFAAEPANVEAAAERLGIGYPIAIDADFDLWADYGCEGWPSLFLWGRGGALRWAHLGEGEYFATELAIQEELREDEPLRELPRPIEPLRPSDAADAKVMAPTAEVFPSGSPERPWVAVGERSEALRADYAAAGAYVTVEGAGTIGVELDGRPSAEVEVDAPGLYELTAHERHERHSLALLPAAGQRIHSLSFAPGVP
ncbi:MAG: hypothetical protein QOG09_303 [Solirubrobacterales bacterium]|nr:hypothetical protein [Solirubrobacterales bacterium]MDX6662201.1 hypothetical protein [Solirubrobacterales bacterium]